MNNINKYIKERNEEFDKNFVHKDGVTLLEPLNAIEVKAHQTETLSGLIELLEEEVEGRLPNEYAVRKYQTLEARTYEEKQLVREALLDFKQTLNNIKKTIN